MHGWEVSLVNAYVAHKQHLRPTEERCDVVQVTRDIVALHSTVAVGPYLSLWARVPGFRREMLDDALYERRELARVLCMRATLHAVPSDELPFFFQACRTCIERRTPRQFQGEGLLVQARLCPAEEAGAMLNRVQHQVLGALAESGPSTLPEITERVPELQAKMRYSIGRSYEGELGIGSRLVSDMCSQGLLIRARPRGTWRSNLYEYAALSAWLPDADLRSVGSEDAQAWLALRYLSAFGPATAEDLQWWTGFTRAETTRTLQTLKPELVEVTLEGLGEGYLVLAGDAQRVEGFPLPSAPTVFFLPGLDPYIMGYRDRRRFLAPEHEKEIFDRAGNSVATIWLDGRVAGAWGQRRDGSVVCKLFEAAGEAEQAMVEAEAVRLGKFLEGEYLPPRYGTAFTRTFEQGVFIDGTEAPP